MYSIDYIMNDLFLKVFSEKNKLFYYQFLELEIDLH